MDWIGWISWIDLNKSRIGYLNSRSRSEKPKCIY